VRLFPILFPLELASHFAALQGSHDVHQLYKIPLRPAGAAKIVRADGRMANQKRRQRKHALAELDRAGTGPASRGRCPARGDGERGHRPAGEPGRDRGSRLVILDDITEREELERKAGPGGQAFLHRPAGRRGGARG